MTPPAKGNGNGGSGFPKWIWSAGLVIGGILAGLFASLLAQPKHDITYEDLVDERIAHIAVQLETLTTAVRQHVALEMHPGTKAAFAKIAGDLNRMSDGIERIEKRLDKMEEK